MPEPSQDIAHRILSGEVLTVARLLRALDDGNASARAVLRELHPHTGHAHVIGFTGVPGAGKSTLIDTLTLQFRKEGLTVGILAVDPTSPFSGGAILGDRVRMKRHFLDEGVFIRSLATRGHFGGLTRSTDDMVRVLDAMGKDLVLIETVGVGQDEIEVAESAQTTVVVFVPGTGDEIQAIKAGITEIGDIFVVNKADRGDSRRVVRELTRIIERCQRTSAGARCWNPPVIETVATRGEGIRELREAIGEHRAFLLADGGRAIAEAEGRRTRALLRDVLREEAFRAVLERLRRRGESIESLAGRIVSKEVDVYDLAREVVGDVGE